MVMFCVALLKDLQNCKSHQSISRDMSGDLLFKSIFIFIVEPKEKASNQIKSNHKAKYKCSMSCKKGDLS